MHRSFPFALSPDLGMVPLRVIVGLVFLMHGYQKLFVFGLDGTTNFMAAVLALLLMLLAPGSAEAQKSERRCTGEPADSPAQLQVPLSAVPRC